VTGIGFEVSATLVGTEKDLVFFERGTARGVFRIDHHPADRVFDLAHRHSWQISRRILEIAFGVRL
jgi:hypothetical protein